MEINEYTYIHKTHLQGTSGLSKLTGAGWNNDLDGSSLSSRLHHERLGV